MKYYLLFITTLMIFASSCQQSELIEETFIEEQTITENDTDVEDRWYQETWQQFGQLVRNDCFIQNNIWNKYTQGAGSQKAWIKDVNNWGAKGNHYRGSGQIKSYPGIVIGKHYGTTAPNVKLPKKVSSLGNMWCEWNQWNTMTDGNVSLDIWFHPTPDHGMQEADYEIMIWTQRRGNLNPIAHAYNANGAIPVDTRWFNGCEYKIYKGTNGNGTHVYTFIQTNNSGQLKGQLKPFVNYCKSKGWLKDYHYLLSVQAGWEMVSGGEATTTKFKVFL